LQSTNLSHEDKENVAKQYSMNRPLSNIPITNPGLKCSLYHEAMESTLLSVKEELVSLVKKFCIMEAVVKQSVFDD